MMKKSQTSLKEIKLVGVSARTSNVAEMNPTTAKIGPTIGGYFEKQLFSKITGRVNPGVTYSVYTNYESDKMGQYTYFVGEEVESFDNVDPMFETLTIPKQNYTKFDIRSGVIPEVCVESWKKIWAMTSEDFGSERSYIADFEIYDNKTHDCNNAHFDIYVGVK